jgi:hypothetical protein
MLRKELRTVIQSMGVLLIGCALTGLCRAQTNIVGSFRYPDTNVVNGYVTIELTKATVTNNCYTPVQLMTFKQKKVNIVNGVLGTLALYPTSCMSPLQSYVVRVYDSSKRLLYKTAWSVPYSISNVDVTVLEVLQ